jgi:hypothetical protein
MDVKETGCRQPKVPHWSVAGDFGALAGLAGHTKRCATNFAVALVPGCDRSWTDWNTCSHKEAGMYGQGSPADVSQ